MKIDSNIVNPINTDVNKSASTLNNGDFDKILENAKKTGDTSELKNVCNELEAVFLNMIMSNMRNTVSETEGLFEKSESEKMFQTMLDEEFSKKISTSGGIGISDMIFDQMEKYIYNEEENITSTFEMKG